MSLKNHGPDLPDLWKGNRYIRGWKYQQEASGKWMVQFPNILSGKESKLIYLGLSPFPAVGNEGL